jgi:hypothetical protein
MLGHHQANDIAPVIFNAVGNSEDRHILSGRRNAGCHDASGLLVFHYTKTTGPDRFQFRVIAQPGNFYPVSFGSLQQAGSRRAIYDFTVNGQTDLFQDGSPFIEPSDALLLLTSGYVSSGRSNEYSRTEKGGFLLKKTRENRMLRFALSFGVQLKILLAGADLAQEASKYHNKYKMMIDYAPF